MIKNILAEYNNSENINKVLSKIELNNSKIALKGIVGSSSSFIISSIFEKSKNSIFCILNDKEEASYFYNDIVKIINKEKINFFPSSFKRNVDYNQKDKSNLILRTETLANLNSKRKQITITYPNALVEKVLIKSQLDKNSIKLKVSQNFEFENIYNRLNEINFQLVDFVFEPGQYSVRGSIVDIFSYSNENPYRIDFFGDQIESIREFNIETQLSEIKTNSILISPDSTDLSDQKHISVLDYIENNTIIIAQDFDFVISTIEKYLTQNTQEINNKINSFKFIDNVKDFTKDLILKNTIEIGNQNYFNAPNVLKFNTLPQPVFNKNFDFIINNINDLQEQNFKTYIFSDSKSQLERLISIFENFNQNTKFISVNTGIYKGFIDNDLKIAVYTDHEIFERFFKYKVKSNFTKKGAITLKELNELSPGDYVVHQDYGIGIFGGLEKINNNGIEQESIRLVYRDNDVLYVNIHSLHKISKYKSGEGKEPKIYKLGTNAWQNLKAKTKTKIKEIAVDLIELYAKRKQQKGFSFSPDSFMNKELEASFIYEDTPDQEKSTQAVKQDMESDIPMDRLVCGDVGFGKTEIAIRAAFKAVLDGKQVAVLVPTTILALQHFKTFSERLKEFSITIDYISRLKSTKQQQITKTKLKEGNLNIIIGTHRLVGKDIKFKDLGLLIIDEEQKFGVAIKEKLREIKVNVDTLTLTATPIPRTLQFSMMGARDLSIINTPPPNRYPIITEVHNFNSDIIKDAIEYEISRGGQVFFIHNRVQNIYEVEKMINRLLPQVKTIVAHGQMEGKQLEKIMLDFIEGDYGVLIATTIIESGLDIPNANTIIINNAQNFGLSTLHQLRGRVGRSNKKAFAYLLAPQSTLLSSEARRRLKAIEDFADLGSGFNIALQDLDIRGAGNLLGAEQSGYIADIGIETYQKILNEAIQELKEKEYKELFANSNNDNIFDNSAFVNDCLIDTDLQLLFPENYIESITERMKLYKELDVIKEQKELNKFTNDLIDRFGKLPKESKELIQVVNLRKVAKDIGIEKIVIKNKLMKCYFISNQESFFYTSKIFTGILNFLQFNPKYCNLIEKNNKLSLNFTDVNNINQAIEKLNFIQTNLNG